MAPESGSATRKFCQARDARQRSIDTIPNVKWLALALGALGVLAGILAVIYFTVPAHSLPSFLGPIPGVKAHRVTRGKAAAVSALLLFILAGAVFFVGGSRSEPGKPSPLDRLIRLWTRLLGR
jgi:hypothetical protein